MAGKYRERRGIPLVRVQVLAGEGKLQPKVESTLNQSLSVGMGLEKPGQLHVEM